MPAVPVGLGEAGVQQSKPRDSSDSLSREDRLKLLVRLVNGKGSAALATLQRRVREGQELSAKGITWDVGLLREALARVNAGTGGQDAKAQPGQAQPPRACPPVPTPARAPVRAPAPGAEPAGAPVPAARAAQPAPAAAAGAAPSGGRWAVAAPTASSLARRAQAESEGAEPFVRAAKNAGEHKVAVLAKPNVLSQATGEYVLPAETFEVIARCTRTSDGRTYLRLKRSTGWVCTRSRKDFWRVVVCGDDGASVEPVGFAAALESRAARLLPQVDAEGRRVDAQGRPQEAAGAGAPEARSFRVAGGRALPILGMPSLEAGAAGALLQAREAFLADAVSLAPADGRAYLRLKDGRGWVSERQRADFQRYAVEPDGHPQDLGAAGARRAAVLSVARGEQGAREAAEDGATEEPAPSRPARGPALEEEAVVFRSDGSLWPRQLAPRPLASRTRAALRRLANLHGRRLAECEEDLREVEGRAEAYARSCEGKKLLLAHAEALRKEVQRAEGAWRAAVEEALAGATAVAASAAPAPGPPAGRGAGGASAAVTPVQVLGRAWHCAVVRAGPGGDGSEAAAATCRRLGPLRSDPVLAANDLRILEAALESELLAGPGEDADGQAPAKRPRRSRGTEDAAVTEGADGRGD